jgi:non-ribosomal peptide synthetase component F
VAAYRRVLEAVAADPERRISRLPLVDDAERKRLVAEGIGTSAPLPREASLHALVEAAAGREARRDRGRGPAATLSRSASSSGAPTASRTG